MGTKRATSGDPISGKGAACNTALSKRSSSSCVSLLVAGCDTFYWSAKASIGSAYEELLEARKRAEDESSPLPWRVIDGHSLSVSARGAGKYRVVLECFEFTVQLTASEHVPTAYVELRSDFIAEVGLEEAFARSVRVVAEIIGQPLSDPHVARIDLYADYAGWIVAYGDYPGFVTNAKRHTDASDAVEYETFRAGKTPFLVRVYRKDIERRQARKAPPPTWNGYVGPVTRVEVQASTEFLRKLGVRTFSEVLASRGDIWRYGTHDFLELREVRRGHKESWVLRPEWELVQRTGFERFPRTGVTTGDRVRLLRLAYGCITSLAAIERCRDLETAIGRVRTLLPLLPRRTPFAEEVRRKRARLPRRCARGDRRLRGGQRGRGEGELRVRTRTFTSQYGGRDGRVKRPDFPLGDAINWFLADKAQEVVETTLRTYTGWLHKFSNGLPDSERILASLTVDRAEAFVRQAKKSNTRMNMTIALKSFARYLAEKHLWYLGTADAPMSVLRGLKQPQPTPFGVPTYTDSEVRAILRAVDCEPHRLRNLAVVAVLLHGFRAKEARLMPLRCVILPTYREQGHFTIAEESHTKRGTRGVRDVPIDPDATEVLRRYVRLERPDYIGTGEEPLFVTVSGRPFTSNGWNAMAQRLKRTVKAETGIEFRQHRSRSTRTRLLHEEGWPDSAIIEVQGWSDGSGYRMLRRYRGRIPTSQLQRYPQTLGRFFGKAV